MKQYIISEDQLNAIANAIRFKTGLSNKMSPSEMATAIREITPENNEKLDALIGRASNDIDSNTATQISAYAFYYYRTLKSVNFPAVVSVGNDAFFGCTELADVNLDSVRSVGARAFAGCSSLRSINFRSSGLSSLQAYCFNGSSLEEIWLPASVFCAVVSTTFYGCPLSPDGTGGKIYLPSRFRTAYEANQNWSSVIGSANNTIISY